MLQADPPATAGRAGVLLVDDHALLRTGVANINGRAVELGAGTMVLIERGDTHEIRNTGRSLLKTVNVYLPPAYADAETELPAGKR